MKYILLLALVACALAEPADATDTVLAEQTTAVTQKASWGRRRFFNYRRRFFNYRRRRYVRRRRRPYPFCFSGYYRSGYGCYGCPSGKYQPYNARTSCYGVGTCAPGTYRAGHSRWGGGSCYSCRAGTYKSSYHSWNTGCTHCPNGQYQPYSRKSHCYSCPAGKYARRGHSYCFHCKRGTYSNHARASYCYSCAPGRHAPNQGHRECPQCARGNYQHLWGKHFCYGCTAGKYQPYTGRTTCYTCPHCHTSGARAYKCYSLRRNCVVSAFGRWGSCSESCDMGKSTRVRTVKITARCGGVACPALSEKNDCMDKPCACVGMTCKYEKHTCTTYYDAVKVNWGYGSNKKVYSMFRHHRTKAQIAISNGTHKGILTHAGAYGSKLYTATVTYTRTQAIASRRRGYHTASTTFRGLPKNGVCKVSVTAMQTDYNWKTHEWLRIGTSNGANANLNTNCGFTKQCLHRMSTCKLVNSYVRASATGILTVRATQGRAVDYCPWKGYYMYAHVKLACKAIVKVKRADWHNGGKFCGLRGTEQSIRVYHKGQKRNMGHHCRMVAKGGQVYHSKKDRANGKCVCRCHVAFQHTYNPSYSKELIGNKDLFNHVCGPTHPTMCDAAWRK